MHCISLQTPVGSGGTVLLGLRISGGKGDKEKKSIFNEGARAPLSYPDLHQMLHPRSHGGRRGYQSSAQTQMELTVKYGVSLDTKPIITAELVS